MSSKQISTPDRIVDAAEKRMRTAGFHGFSFREIAADVGIKSASVHHHFPTKEDLAAAAASAYADRFMAALGDPGDVDRTPISLIEDYVGLFMKAQISDRRMCLCGILASEARDLPDKVAEQARRFFERNVTWLQAVLVRTGRTGCAGLSEAQQIVAALEGAMMIANVTGDDDAFKRVAGSIVAQLK